jgi:hypothetical protein
MVMAAMDLVVVVTGAPCSEIDDGDEIVMVTVVVVIVIMMVIRVSVGCGSRNIFDMVGLTAKVAVVLMKVSDSERLIVWCAQ